MFALSRAVKILLLFYLSSESTSAASLHYENHGTCKIGEGNEKQLHFIQRMQYERAWSAVYGNEIDHSITQISTLHTLRESGRGAVDLLTSTNPGKYTSVVYYKQSRKLDNHISRILLRYASIDRFILGCPPNQCNHPLVQRVHPGILRGSNGVGDTLGRGAEPSKRFAFTFVREPISRFVSAMTEVEYRLSGMSKGSEINTLKHARGSHERFQEFFRMILSKLGQYEELNKAFSGINEINHIFPMIGTILTAQSVEKNHFHLYRVEDFDSGWSKLALDSDRNDTLVRALSSFRNTFHIHPSSSDPFHTTLAAKSFLSFASTDAAKRLFSKNVTQSPLSPPTAVNSSEYVVLAKSYYVALCRVYLLDYLCAGYELPADCRSLIDEVREAVPHIDRWSAILSMVCTNATAVIRIQQRQLCHAKASILWGGGFDQNCRKLMENSAITTIIANNNCAPYCCSAFYTYTFGALNILIGSDTGQNPGLIYYRIFKNANDYIRLLLYNYAFLKTGSSGREHNLDTNSFLESLLTVYHSCPVGKCSHFRVNELSATDLRLKYFSSTENRYPFTFVQSPIERYRDALLGVDASQYLDQNKTTLRNKDDKETVENMIRRSLGALLNASLGIRVELKNDDKTLCSQLLSASQQSSRKYISFPPPHSNEFAANATSMNMEISSRQHQQRKSEPELIIDTNEYIENNAAALKRNSWYITENEESFKCMNMLLEATVPQMSAVLLAQRVERSSIQIYHWSSRIFSTQRRSFGTCSNLISPQEVTSDNTCQNAVKYSTFGSNNATSLSFNTQWKQFVKDSTIDALYSVFQELYPEEVELQTLLNENNTTYVVENNDSNFNSAADFPIDITQLLCRMYLTDFLCLGFDLPSECAFLTLEVEKDMIQYEKKINPSMIFSDNNDPYFSNDLLGSTINVIQSAFHNMLYGVAAVYCYTFTRSPECVERALHAAGITYSTNIEEDYDDYA